MTAWCHLPTIFKQRHALQTAGLFALCVALITTLLLANVSLAAPNVTKTINFQGRLLKSTGAVVEDGHYNIQFKIYQDGSGSAAGNPGGTLKWTESYINNGGTSGVEVKNGFFSVSLGSLNPFGTSVDWNQDTLWLSMNVAGAATDCTSFDAGSCSADGEMLPMRRITATPYAINSGAVGGKTVNELIHNTTDLQAGSNIALQSGNDSDITAYIEGRTNQSSSNLVIKQGSSQTGKALDVQDSSGSSYFNIDATGTLNQTGNATFSGNLGVGTLAPSRPLDVAVSNSSTNSLPVRIAQQGTGDAGIELSANGSSKYSVGIDASDGSFKVASSIAGGSTTTIGDSTIGATDGTGNYQHVQAQKYTATETGSILNMSVYLSSVDSFCPNVQLGVYADNGSGTAPGSLLGKSAQTAGTTGWNTMPLTASVNVTSGTIYWLSLATDCDDTTKLTTGVGTRAHMTGSTLPNTFATESTSAGRLSLYATVDTSGGAADSFGGNATIFNLGPTGDATFKNAVDSTNAFQVQDSSGKDILSVNTDDASGAANVQIGTGSGSGATSLLTLDKASSAPTVQDQSALLGSMYYDTTLGKVQCYESEGWGACGAAPDSFVTISPEYTNAVMNGTDIGTITSDLCSDTLNINDGSSSQPTVCGTNETYNFYDWTSAETTDQTRSIFVTYQLPASFKEFVPGTTSLMGRTDSADSAISYQIYRDDGSGLTSCGSAVSVTSGAQTTWQKATASGGADPSACGFSAGDSVLFRINLISKNDANAYVSNLGFTFSNN
jgi:hypothetical protein